MNEPQALVRLQEVDLALLRHRKTLAAMPQQERLRAIEQAKRKLSTELKKIIGQRKDVEMELADNEEAQQKILERTEEAKERFKEREQNYRQVQDLEAQLTSLAKRQEKLEYTNLEISERLERLQKAERNAKGVGERLLKEEAATKEAYQRASADLMADIRILENERGDLLRHITPPTMEAYDAAVKRFGGLAVERLASNVPSICRVSLQPALYAKLRKGSRIAECPYCHRMLVVEEL